MFAFLYWWTVLGYCSVICTQAMSASTVMSLFTMSRCPSPWPSPLEFSLQGSCPECGAQIDPSSLAPNFALRSVVSAFRRECSALAAMASAAGDVGPMRAVPGGSGSLDNGRTWASTLSDNAVEPGRVRYAFYQELTLELRISVSHFPSFPD